MLHIRKNKNSIDVNCPPIITSEIGDRTTSTQSKRCDVNPMTWMWGIRDSLTQSQNHYFISAMGTPLAVVQGSQRFLDWCSSIMVSYATLENAHQQNVCIYQCLDCYNQFNRVFKMCQNIFLSKFILFLWSALLSNALDVSPKRVHHTIQVQIPY